MAVENRVVLSELMTYMDVNVARGRMPEETRDVFTRSCRADTSPAQDFELHGVIEMLRLRASGTSNRQIAMSCDVSSPSVSEYLPYVGHAWLSCQLPDVLSDAALCIDSSLPPMMCERACVTQLLLHQEHRHQHPQGISTAGSIIRIISGWVNRVWSRARISVPGRSCLWTTPTIRRRSSISTLVISVMSRSSSPCRRSSTTPTLKPPGRRDCKTGSTPTSEPSSSLAVY